MRECNGVSLLRYPTFVFAGAIRYVNEAMTSCFLCALDSQEAEKVLQMLPLKYPDRPPLPIAMPGPEDVRIFRVKLKVISVPDYTKGFGHTDLVTD